MNPLVSVLNSLQETRSNDAVKSYEGSNFSCTKTKICNINL